MRPVFLRLGAVVMVFINLNLPAFAADGFRANTKDILTVMTRGMVNVATSPLEAPRAFKVERKEHKWLWPVTFVPRYFTSTVYRFVSGAMDFALHPFIVPFTEETPRPWTEPMGLPDYVWQKGDSEF